MAGVILIAGIGGIDYLTGYEMAFSLFYLLPIAFVTWFVGRRTGVAVSVLAAAAWLVADAEAGHLYSHPATLYWNGVLRLGFFLTVTLLLAALQKSLLHKRELSRVDSLTGTINGRYFMEVMQVEIERSRRYSRPFTLVYLDVATIIRSHLRTTDSVARLGGMGLFSPAQGLPCPFYYNHYASNC